jgi:hypothetical protein
MRTVAVMTFFATVGLEAGVVTALLWGHSAQTAWIATGGLLVMLGAAYVAWGGERSQDTFAEPSPRGVRVGGRRNGHQRTWPRTAIVGGPDWRYGTRRARS